jgi:hypothetical protein
MLWQQGCTAVSPPNRRLPFSCRKSFRPGTGFRRFDSTVSRDARGERIKGRTTQSQLQVTCVRNGSFPHRHRARSVFRVRTNFYSGAHVSRAHGSTIPSCRHDYSPAGRCPTARQLSEDAFCGSSPNRSPARIFDQSAGCITSSLLHPAPPRPSSTFHGARPCLSSSPSITTAKSWSFPSDPTYDSASTCPRTYHSCPK